MFDKPTFPRKPTEAMTLVWIAQGVDFSTPCRQRLIPFKPLTNRQKYKSLGSSTLLRKAAFGVPVFFGVQGSSTLLCKAAFGVPVFFGVQNIHRLKALKLRFFPLGFQLGNPTPQDMRAAFYG